MAKVSVTVPVYKTEKYLERCVGALLCQTLEDIEIILVDDGSPDACPEMCDRFAETDGRIKVVHRENGGLGFARNSGIDVSTGEFIGFVDSDDYVSPDMFEKLYNAAKEHDAQIAMSGLCCVGGIMVSKEDDVQYINCFDKTEIFDGTDGNTLILHRQKERIFMSGHRDDFCALSHIVTKGFFHLIAEIYNSPVTAFSLHNNTTVIKIHILDIKADTFGNTDTGSE